MFKKNKKKKTKNKITKKPGTSIDPVWKYEYNVENPDSIHRFVLRESIIQYSLLPS